MSRLSYVWDYEIDEETFQALLDGRTTVGRLDRDWAAVRLLEHAPYREIVRRLGFRGIVEGWPAWRSRIRSQSRRRGFDFLADWIPSRHPELLDSGPPGPQGPGYDSNEKPAEAGSNPQS